MAVATVPKHTCARCGKRQRAEQMIYSRHTRNRYCRDFGACDRRTLRRGP